MGPMLLQVAARAETLLVRPVELPTPWYSAASGILSIVTTLLLVGVIVALLGVARALKGVEHRMADKLKGLSDELVPLVRTLNGAAGEVAAITRTVRGDLHRLSETVSVVDDSVRHAIGAAETRLATFAALIDTVQEEATEAVASATGLMRGIRGGTRSIMAELFPRGRGRRTASRRADDARRTRPPVPDDRLEEEEDEDEDVVEEVMRPGRARVAHASAGDEDAQALIDELDASLEEVDDASDDGDLDDVEADATPDEYDDLDDDDFGDGDDMGLAQVTDAPRGPRIKPRPRRSA